MQNNEQSLLLIHRENYTVPKGQEQTVHCKIAKEDSNGNLIEKPRLVRYGVKSFETIFKTNLETMGYTVEILYHPLKKYSNVRITDKDTEIAQRNIAIVERDRKIEEAANAVAERDAEIARLKAELAEARKNKGGRPKKEE